jgi:hypothetical protein
VCTICQGFVPRRGQRLEKVSNGTGDRHSVSSEFPRDDTDPATDIEQSVEEVCHIDVAVSDSLKESGVECVREEIIYEPIRHEDLRQGPQVSY